MRVPSHAPSSSRAPWPSGDPAGRTLILGVPALDLGWTQTPAPGESPPGRTVSGNMYSDSIPRHQSTNCNGAKTVIREGRHQTGQDGLLELSPGQPTGAWKDALQGAAAQAED